MRCASAVLLLTILAYTALAGGGDPTDPKNWLKENTWPALVSSRWLEVKDQDDTLTKLLKERFNAVQQELRDRYIYWLQGHGSLDQVADAARRALTSRLEVKTPPADRLQLLKERAEWARVVEKQAEILRQKKGTTQNAIDRSFAKSFRLDAEIELARAAKPPAKK